MYCIVRKLGQYDLDISIIKVAFLELETGSIGLEGESLIWAAVVCFGMRLS